MIEFKAQNYSVFYLKQYVQNVNAQIRAVQKSVEIDDNCSSVDDGI